MTKLVFGCGYLGQRVARRWRAAGEHVVVVTRSAERAQAFAAEGFTPLVADVVRPETLTSLPPASTVLYAIGYDRAAGAAMREVYVDGLRSVLNALPDRSGKLVYISSSGVHGQSNGESVDEDSACVPGREAGRVCLDAEQVLMASEWSRRAIILRLAGLYGPGRIPNAMPIRAGQPIAVDEQGWLNLIHVDDAVQVVLAAELLSDTPRTYLVSDGVPVLRREYYAQLARELNATLPRFTTPLEASPAALRSGQGQGKRIDNSRMRNELRVSLRFPTYREGLAAIVAGEAT